MTRKLTTLWFCLALAAGLFGVLPAFRALAITLTSSGSQDARPANDISCNGAGGVWSATSTWSGGVLPAATDFVIIGDGCTVTIDTDATIYALVVGQGASGVLQFEADSARTLTVTTSVTIASGASFRSAATGAVVTHRLSVGADLINHGTLDFSTNGNTAGARIVFVGPNDAAFSLGGGSSTDLRQTAGVTLDKGTSIAPVVTFIPAGFFTVEGGSAKGFLSISSGTFKIAGSSSLTNPVFNAAGYTIPATGSLWLNNAEFNVSGQAGSPTLNGALRISSGVYNIGTSSGNSVGYNSGAVLTIEGGTLNVAGRIARVDASDTLIYNQSGGSVTVVMRGSTSTTRPGFDLGHSTSSFMMTGGTIIVQQATGNTVANGGDYFVAAGIYNVTGGTLQIGNSSSPNATTIRVSSTTPLGNLLIDGSTSQLTKPTAQLVTTGLAVRGDVTIGPGTTFNANGQSTAISGNWTDNGIFTAGAGTVAFDGVGEQVIDGSSVTAFNNLAVAPGTVVVISEFNPPTVAGTLINYGTLKQTKSVAGNNAVDFLMIGNGTGGTTYYGVTIDPVDTNTQDLDRTTVSIGGNQVCSQANGYPVRRCFNATPANQQPTDITFYFQNSEMQTGQTAISLKVWNYHGGLWTEVTRGADSAACDSGAIDCWVQGAGISDYSPFVLKNSDPTAIILAEFSAVQQADYVLLTWETNSELSNRGFNLYRGTSTAGPNRQLNDALIPSQSQGNPGGFVYTWEDRADLVPGAAYFYWVEDVDIYGAATMHGPVGVDFAVPTAVTLSDMEASTAAGSSAMPLAGTLLVLVVLLAVRRLRRLDHERTK